MSPFFFPDNTVLINFHLLGRWDLLNEVVGDQARWCGSVERECRTSTVTNYPGMHLSAKGIFGTSLYPSPAEHVDAQTIRINMANPLDDWPTRHLGEAETIAIAQSRFAGSRFLTDDADAQRVAQATGITCYGTGDLLVVAEKRGSITAAQQSAMEQKLSVAGRLIRYFRYAK